MRLLVCGGREYRDVPRLWAILDGIDWRDKERGGDGIRCLIEGAQVKTVEEGLKVGADYWAHQWALANGRTTCRFPADWEGYGRAAGPKRNQYMFDEGRPTHGLAMPGGRGTASMVRIMKAGGIPVIEITE